MESAHGDDMEHTWKKKIGHGTMTFTTTGEPGVGFVHTATFEGGDVIKTKSVKSTLQPTREDVEKIFAEFIFLCRDGK
jgi:hypothetical protein